jgi:integrase
MSVRRDKDGTWRYRIVVKLPNGKRTRISGTPTINTKLEAEREERAHVHRVLNPPPAVQQVKEAPLFAEFGKQFLDVCVTKDKPSTLRSKEMILRVHLTPAFGTKRLDEIKYGDIVDYSARKARKLQKKTVNNHLSLIHRVLAVACKRGLIVVVPEIEWLKAPQPDFDFLTFEEAEKLVVAAHEDWRCMILLALRTGLRQGELLALRWSDVDLVAGRVTVRRSVTKGRVLDAASGELVAVDVVTGPKSGKAREVPLGAEILGALQALRSRTRSKLVFPDAAGEMRTSNGSKHPLWRACERAGIRHIRWHCLRHTFASHLAMRGVPLKVVQELLGHATMDMTMRYAHLSPSVPQDAVRLLDGRGKGVAKTSASGEDAEASDQNGSGNRVEAAGVEPIIFDGAGT